MNNKLFTSALMLLFVLPLTFGISSNQPKNEIIVEQEVVHSPPEEAIIEKEIEEIWEVYEVTAYDLSIQCCGKSYSYPTRGITKSGYNLNNKSRIEAMTVGSTKFPMGTKIYIEFPESHKQYNGEYCVIDTGNFKENVLDLYIGDFGEKVGQETINFGRVKAKVIANN